MPNRIYRRFVSPLAAQASVAVAADALSGSAGQLDLVTNPGGNIVGADSALVLLTITAPPTTQTLAELYIEESLDGGVSFALPRKIATFSGVVTSAGAHSAWLHDLPSAFRLQWLIASYGATGRLDLSATYPEIQATT